jgi:hypothetical protein
MKTKQLLLTAAMSAMTAMSVYAQDTLQGHITTNRTLNAGTGTTQTTDNIYYIRGYVYVDAGVTLTIRPGCVLQGLNFTGTDGVPRVGTLIISRGARIDAQGTGASPIVFTSNKLPGFRQKGDWGGIVIAGNAPTNLPAGTLLEGGVAGGAALAQPRYEVPFGGTVANDNSGTLRNVCIEWPGFALAVDQEINGLTLAGVGSGTTIDRVQVSHSNDDSFEWFGGTVNCTRLISWKAADDDFDTDNGYSGQCQYGIAFRACDVADFAAGGRSNGFESDNNATGSTATPKTTAKFYNFTILGPQRATTDAIAAPYTSSSAAAYIRRNTEIDIYASVLAGFPNGVSFDGDPVVNNANAVSPNNIEILRSVFAADDVRDLDVTTGGIYLNPSANTWFSTRNDVGVPNANSNATGLQLRSIGANCAANNQNGTLKNTFDPRPTTTGILLSGGLTAAEKTASGALAFVQTVSFRGACGGTGVQLNWPLAAVSGTGANQVGFAEYDPQAVVYNPGDITIRAAANEELPVVAMYPNPTNTGMFTAAFESTNDVVATINIFDVAGKLVKSTTASVAVGYNAIEVDGSDLNNGIYIVNIQAGELVQNTRMVINK